jgi:eukaryotic-like serine/threonine-protein kinase
MTKKLVYLLFFVALIACSKKDTEPIKSSAKSISSFSFSTFNPAINSSIDSVQRVITAFMPFGTNIANLAPAITISNKATVSPASGSVQDFTKPVIYTVTAEDGSSQTYTVKITIGKNPAKIIKSFSISEISASLQSINIDTTKKIITLTIPANIDLSSKTPVITISDKATIFPASGTPQNFNKPITYKVTAEDGTTVNYSVVVKLTAVINNNGSILFGTGDGYFRSMDLLKTEIKWSFLTGGSIISSPFYANGYVFFGSKDKKVYALDANTGEKKWDFLTDGIVTSSPIVVENIVYIGSEDGYLYALDTNSGKLIWKYLSDNGRIVSSPTFYNGNIYLCTHSNTLSSNPTKIYALNSKSGSLVWMKEMRFKDNNFYELISSPTIYKNQLFFVNTGQTNSELTALDLTTRQINWSAIVEGFHSTSRPIIKNDTVFMATSLRSLNAFNYKTGSKYWTYVADLYNDTGNRDSSPFVSGGSIYFATFSGGVQSINLLNGKKNWSFNFGNNTINTFISSPVVTNEFVICTQGESQGSLGALIVIDKKTGLYKWFYTNYFQGFKSSPCVIDEKGNVFHSSLNTIY